MPKSKDCIAVLCEFHESLMGGGGGGGGGSHWDNQDLSENSRTLLLAISLFR